MPITYDSEGDALDRLYADVKANSEQQQLPVDREVLVQQALDSILNGTSDNWLSSVMIKPELASSILLDAQKQFENERAKTGIVSLQTGFNKDSTNAANKDGIISVLRSTAGNMIGKYIDYQQFQDLNNAKNPKYFQGEGADVIQNPSMWAREKTQVGTDIEGNPIYQDTGRYQAYVNAYDIGNKGTLIGQTVTVDSSGKIVDVSLNYDQRGQGVLKEFLTSGVFPMLMTPFLGPLAGYIGSVASSAGITLSTQLATAAAQSLVNSIPQIAAGADPGKILGSIAINIGAPVLADKLAIDPNLTKIAGNVLNAALDPENFVQRLATFTIQDLATSQIGQYLQDNNLITNANIANKTAGLVVQTALSQGKNLEAIMTNPAAMMNFVRSNQDLISTALNTATQEQAAQGMTALERMAFADANASTQGLTSPAEFVQKTGKNEAQWRDFYAVNQEAARNMSPQEFYDQTGMTQAQFRDFLEQNFGPAEIIGELGAQQDARAASLVLQTIQNPKLVVTADQARDLYPMFESYAGPNGTTFVRDVRNDKIYQVFGGDAQQIEGGEASLKPKMLGAVESLPATALYQGVIYSKDFNDTLPSTNVGNIDPNNLVLSRQVDETIKPVGNLVLIKNDDGTVTQRDKLTGDWATFDPEGRIINQTKSLMTRLNELERTVTGTGIAGLGELGEAGSQALRQIGLSNDDVTAAFTRLKESGERMRPEFVNQQAQAFVNEIYQVAADVRSSGTDIGKAIFKAAINNPVGAAAVVGQELFQELPSLLLPGGKVAQFLGSIALNVAESAGAAALQKVNDLKESDRQASMYYGSTDPNVSYTRSNDQYVKDAMGDAKVSGLVTAAMTLVPGVNNVVGRNLVNTFSESLEEGLTTYLNTGNLAAAKGNAVLGGVIGGKTGAAIETGEALASAMQNRLSTSGLVPKIYSDSGVTAAPKIGTLTFTAKREAPAETIASEFSTQQQAAIDEIMGSLNGTIQSIDYGQNVALVQLDNGDVEVIDASNLALNPGDKIQMSDSSLVNNAISRLTDTNLYVASTFGDKALVVDSSGNKAVVSIKDTDIKPGQVIGSVDGSGTTDLNDVKKAQDDLAARTYNGVVYDTAAEASAAKAAAELAATKVPTNSTEPITTGGTSDLGGANDVDTRVVPDTSDNQGTKASGATYTANTAATPEIVAELLALKGLPSSDATVRILLAGNPTVAQVGQEIESLALMRNNQGPSSTASTGASTTGTPTITTGQQTDPTVIDATQQNQSDTGGSTEQGVKVDGTSTGSVVTDNIVADAGTGVSSQQATQPLLFGKYQSFDEFQPGEFLVRTRFQQAGKSPTDQEVQNLLDAASKSGINLSDPNAGSTPEYQAWASLVYDTSVGNVRPNYYGLDIRTNIVPPDTVSTEDTVPAGQETLIGGQKTILGGQSTVTGGQTKVNNDDVILNHIRNDSVIGETEPQSQPQSQPQPQPQTQSKPAGTPFDVRGLMGLFPFLAGKTSSQGTEYVDYAQPTVPAPELYGIYQLPTPEYTRATGPTAPVGIMSGETK